MRKKNGFSLVEVIVVITVLAIVLAIAIGIVQNNVDKANEKVEVIISQNVIEALNLYSKEFNKEINWAVNGASVKSACVPFSKLVDKGYLKENEMLDGYKGNNIRINLTTSVITIFIKVFIKESFIMTNVKIGLNSVFSHKNFTMLSRIHCSWINI